VNGFKGSGFKGSGFNVQGSKVARFWFRDNAVTGKSEPQNRTKANRRTGQKRTAEPQNVECRMSKDGFASGFAFGYDPTGRSVLLKIKQGID
jgi:hypothetical protein